MRLTQALLLRKAGLHAAAGACAGANRGRARTWDWPHLGGKAWIATSKTHSLVFRSCGLWQTQAEPGSKLLLGRVLALKEAGQFHVGRPYLEDVRVEADVMAEVKAPKVVIFKMRAKKHYRRKTGHRQPLTKFLITKIARA